MLDQVTGMRVFVCTAISGSLAGAGRSLGMSQTMVTKHVDATEARLGVRLLQRSTRRLTLTEAGRAYLESSRRILADIEEAEEAASIGRAEPRGHVRINMPVSFGTRQIAPLAKDFAARYPLIELEFGLNDRIVDLAEEGWDLAVRIGHLPDTSLVSKRLAPCRTLVCASPSYIAERGAPLTVDALRHHACLGYTLSSRIGADRWSFGTDGSIKVEVSGGLRANNGDALREAALSGMGIVYQPTFVVGDDVRSGALVAFRLDHPCIDAGHVNVIFPQDRRMPSKTRVTIDFLAERFGKNPPWDVGL